jgi:hypothetical protein
MDLYIALQTCLKKIKENNDNVAYSKDYVELLRTIRDNQERLAESILILGTVVHGILEKDVDLEIFPDKDALKN